MTQQERAARYLAKLPAAVAGQGGHAATFVAACRLVEFGLDEAAAWELLCEWNTRCKPPWSEGDLRHKLVDAFHSTEPKPGFAVTGRPQVRGAASRDVPGCDHARSSHTGRVTAAPEPQPAPRRPLRLPMLVRGTDRQLSTLANLRGLSVSGVRLASAKGLLRFADYLGHSGRFILDQSKRIAQARRLDGLPWSEGVKVRTLVGSQAQWPVGIMEAAQCGVVALCEGSPDLIAACHFIHVQRRTDVAPVTILAGSARIHPDALPLFAGKRVRIFGHVDKAGNKTVERWTEQLTDVGATVDAFSLDGLSQADGQPVKDLNDLARMSAADFAARPCLQSLFP